MSGVPEGRLVAGMYEALSASNRRVNNVSGLSGNTNASGYATVAQAWTTITSITIQVPQPAMDLMVWSYVSFGRQTGTLGDTFSAEIQKDSDPDNSQLNFPVDASFQSASVPNDTLNRTFTLIAKYIGLAPGQHTIRVKCIVNGDTFQAFATLDLVSLGITQS